MYEMYRRVMEKIIKEFGKEISEVEDVASEQGFTALFIEEYNSGEDTTDPERDLWENLSKFFIGKEYVPFQEEYINKYAVTRIG